jgi:hypothetical protein
MLLFGETRIGLTGAGPAPVHKLGHFGLCVTDFALSYDFFTSRFNFKASDVRTFPIPLDRKHKQNYPNICISSSTTRPVKT